MDYSLPGSSIHGIFQAGVLEWGAIAFSAGFFCRRVTPELPDSLGSFPQKVESESEVAESCPTPSDPMDCGPPGSAIHGTLQARVLEWGAITFSGVKA